MHHNTQEHISSEPEKLSMIPAPLQREFNIHQISRFTSSEQTPATRRVTWPSRSNNLHLSRRPCLANTRPALRWTINRWHIPTHHFEVLGAALHPPVVAGEQHVLDVVARPVVEFAHVEGAGLVAVEVGPLLQRQQDALLDHVRIPDLIPGNLRSEDVRGRLHTSIRQVCLALKSTVVRLYFVWLPALVVSGQLGCK